MNTTRGKHDNIWLESKLWVWILLGSGSLVPCRDPVWRQNDCNLTENVPLTHNMLDSNVSVGFMLLFVCLICKAKGCSIMMSEYIHQMQYKQWKYYS